MKKNGWFKVLAMVLVFAMLLPAMACGKKSGSGSYELVMRTDKGAWLVGEKGKEVVPKNVDSYWFSDDFSKSVYLKGSKLYYFDGKNEEQICKDCSSVITTGKNLGAVLYLNEDGVIMLWTGKDPVETEIEDVEYIISYMLSENGKYAAVFVTDDSSDSFIYQVDMAKGGVAELTDEPDRLVGVTDKGTVYYLNEDADLCANSGKKETALAEEVTAILYCIDEDKFVYTNEDAELVLRGSGEKDKEEVIAEDVQGVVSVNAGRSVGYMGSGSGTAKLWNSLVLYADEDGAAWTLNVKSGDTAMLVDDGDAEDLVDIRFTDGKTAYAVLDDELVLLTLGKKEWSYETVCKNAADGMFVTRGGAILAIDDDTVTLIDGKKATEITDELDDDYRAFGDDGKSLAFVDDGDLLYVTKPGAKAEKVAKDAADSGIAIYDGKVWYINDDGTLCTVDAKGKVKEIMEDIASFSFRAK